MIIDQNHYWRSQTEKKVGGGGPGTVTYRKKPPRHPHADSPRQDLQISELLKFSLMRKPQMYLGLDSSNSSNASVLMQSPTSNLPYVTSSIRLPMRREGTDHTDLDLATSANWAPIKRLTLVLSNKGRVEN